MTIGRKLLEVLKLALLSPAAIAQVSWRLASLISLCSHSFAGGPVALDGGRRHSESLRSLLNGKPAEKSQLNHSGLLRVELGESMQCVIECDEIDAPILR
jgi:hypothetical protein